MNRRPTRRKGCWRAWGGALATISCTALGGCGNATEEAAPRVAASAVAATDPSAVAAASASPAPAASAAPRHPLAGAWAGTYRSERAKPTLSPTVVDASWSKDKGAHGTGEGRITLDIDDEGGIRGELLGPLGPADLVGQVEGNHALANLVPRGDDGTSFAGIVEGIAKGEGLEVTIRAADGAALSVRAARAALTRPAPPR